MTDPKPTDKPVSELAKEIANLEARLEAAEHALNNPLGKYQEQRRLATHWEEVAKGLERERDEAERLLRLTCAMAFGYDTGNQSLEFLRKEQSPELADISIGIDMRLNSLRRELGEARDLVMKYAHKMSEITGDRYGADISSLATEKGEGRNDE